MSSRHAAFLAALAFLASAFTAAGASSGPPDPAGASAQRAAPAARASTADRPPEFRTESFPLRLTDGHELQVMIRRPAATLTGRLPAILVFGGFQEAARVLDLVNPGVPVLLASFDYPFSPPRKFRLPESLKHVPEAKLTIHRTIEGIQALAGRLAGAGDVDPERITVIGASLGAPLAGVAAARSKDISGVVLIHGFGEVPLTIAHQFNRKWEPRFGPAARVFSWLLARTAWWYLDVEHPEKELIGLPPEKRVLMVSAENDSFVPREASESLWRSLERSRAVSTRLVLPGDHLQPGSDRLIARILEETRVWMSRNLLLQ